MVDSNDIESHLAHYGVLGMKWGVRKDRRTGVRSGSPRAGKGRTKREEREIANRKRASQNRRTLTDADIEKRIKRLEMERKLKMLTDQDIAPGKTFAKKVMSEQGRKAIGFISTAAFGALAFAAKQAFERKYDPDYKSYKLDVDKLRDMNRHLFPNPNQKKK